MRYPRPAYRDSGVKTEIKKSALGGAQLEVPIFDTPITPLENFKRVAARDNPLWVTNSTTDIQTLMAQEVVYKDDRGTQIHTDFRDSRNAIEDYDFTDWFNTTWTWVASAGGAMLKPGSILVEDILDWERVIKWPVLSEWDFASRAADFMRNEYKPGKVMHYDIGRGGTERFISLVGGYTEGMLAMAEEPEAVLDLLNRYADFEIELFDTINALYPLDMVTYHDDWGTERDTFFSERMMEEIVFAPTKRIIDHIKSKGVAFELHSCGNIARFLPYMADLGADFLQIQRRAVNIPEMKKNFGDKIGFNSGIEGLPFGASVSSEEAARLIKNTVDIYGKGGGFYTSIFSGNTEQLWMMLAELYAYSREYYDIEQGRA